MMKHTVLTALICLTFGNCTAGDPEVNEVEQGLTAHSWPYHVTLPLSRLEVPAQAPLPVGLRYAGDITAAQDHRFTNSYPVLSQRDVIAVATIPKRTGVFVVRLTVKNGGSTYQEHWRAYSTDPDAPLEVPHPRVPGETLPVEYVAPQGNVVTLYIGIPIAGTQFTQWVVTGLVTGSLFIEGLGGLGTLVVQDSFELVGP